MSHTYIRAFVLALIVACVPFSVSAADAQPTCQLYVITPTGILEFERGTVAVEEDALIGIIWNARADYGIDRLGTQVPLLGFEILNPPSDDPYEYTFTRGGANVTCSVTFERPSEVVVSNEDATLAVSAIPLLMGGNVSAGSSAPVAYIRVANTSNAGASIDGFRLVENGSAPDDVVVGFATNDDKGGSRSTIVGGFDDGFADVPLEATFAPGQMRIFTIKAILDASSALHYGTQLKIDVAGIDTDAEVTGTFPIRGTTLTLTY